MAKKKLNHIRRMDNNCHVAKPLTCMTVATNYITVYIEDDAWTKQRDILWHKCQ